MDIGRIEALALRPSLAVPPERVERVRAIAFQGLEGDVHADPLSPRQLLLAGTDAYDAFALPPHTLRENLLVDVDTSRLVSGTVLQVGDSVLLRLMFQCEACGHLDAHQPGLSRPGLSTRIGTRRGMLARVLRGGEIRLGDRIRTAGAPLPAWSDDWRERIVHVLDTLPPASVITYKRLAQLAGVASSYCRAFPGMIARLGPRYAGKAVPSQSDIALPRWDGHGLFDPAPAERLFSAEVVP
ncbi:MOSC domain-containing protein YiiM [Massilia sp. PDC64]|nr:MOSC domain-containing protein [Massilia sp. PDC64]SDE20769.1 MOSC domain-containing protein YiiM [Massilia sp. PDC64]